MCWSESDKFIPKTPTVNSDREYYVHHGKFIKIDDNVSRGMREAFILSVCKERKIQNVPVFMSSNVVDNRHQLVMRHCEGETLENLRGQLSSTDKGWIIGKLLLTIASLMVNDIAHGDLNISNVLVDMKSYNFWLVDFEMGELGTRLTVDIYRKESGNLIKLLQDIENL